MKRSLVAALIVGVIVSAIVIALHAMRVTLPLEEMAVNLLSGGRPVARVIGVPAQYAIVLLLSVSVAWLVISSSRRKRLSWPIGILALEVVTLSWVCLLYQVFFQPLPAVLAIALSFLTAASYASFAGRPRRVKTSGPDFFRGRLSGEQLARLERGEVTYSSEAKGYEVTAVVCDMANKHDLAEELSPEEFGALLEKFMRHATESFLEAGAYIESAGGEGILAVFGFPGEDAEQADRATRHALALLESFEDSRARNGDQDFTKFDVHLGISSGTMVVAPLQRDGRAELLMMGEPVELARRFCIANRFYGSRILMGPRTFELTSRTVLARPIDFLSGVDVRERHEIYEPLISAAKATPEQIARRDSFWSGVVLYREKRWGEAYTQFQQARGPGDREDAPLQLYLRRIEPLALHLAIAGEE